jgi:predicted amidophosphoribosyltransferase
MKSCPKCQTEMDDNERSCPQCGHHPDKHGFFSTLFGLFQPKSATFYLDLGNRSPVLWKRHTFSSDVNV